MTLKPKRRDEKVSRQEELSRKWGYQDPIANETMEKNHRQNIQFYQDNMDRLSVEQRKYYAQFPEYEKKWQEGSVSKYHDYWMTPEQYDQIPETMELREIRFGENEFGHHEAFTVITTLTDPEKYSKEEILIYMDVGGM